MDKQLEQAQQAQQQDVRPEGLPPAGYFWHTECAQDTCKQPRPGLVCPPKTICQRCGILEHNKPFCPKVGHILYHIHMELLEDTGYNIFFIKQYFFIKKSREKFFTCQKTDFC